MNRSILSYFIISVSLIMGIGCDGPVDHTRPESAILKSPVFAGINDSIRQFPKDAILFLRRARLLSQNDAHEIAYADYKKSWELNPSKETGLSLAANLSITGKPMEKIELLKKCLEMFPDDPEFRRLMGESYMEGGKPAMALELYNNLLNKDSLDFESWYEKGLALQQMKDTAGALEALKKAYSLQPVNTYALELAHLYAENKNPIALKICDDVISKDSAKELVDPFFIKGIYYANTKQYKQAAIAFDICIRRDWKFTDAYVEKGIVFFKQENYDEALNTFRMAATVSNTEPDSYYWIGRCYEVINKKEEAIMYYERALALDKNFTEASEALKRLRS